MANATSIASVARNFFRVILLSSCLLTGLVAEANAGLYIGGGFGKFIYGSIALEQYAKDNADDNNLITVDPKKTFHQEEAQHAFGKLGFSLFLISIDAEAVIGYSKPVSESLFKTDDMKYCSGMLNLSLNAPIGILVSPYVGFGVGGTYVDTGDKSAFPLSAQIRAGFTIGPSVLLKIMQLQVGYRLLMISSQATSDLYSGYLGLLSADNLTNTNLADKFYKVSHTVHSIEVGVSVFI